MKKHPVEAKRKIGYLPESTPLYGDMRVGEYLQFCAKAKGVKGVGKEVQRVLENVGIEHRKDSLITNLSKGLKQRVGIGQALIGDPEILILDEPTIGLDPTQITQMRALIANLGEEKTVLISSHILTEIQAVCSKVIIINEGKIIACDKIENLGSADKKHANRLTIEISGDDETRGNIIKKIKNIDGVKSVETQISSRSSLEDIYINLITGNGEEK
jgi:ABC-2 type transport system ATP-binding protein